MRKVKNITSTKVIGDFLTMQQVLKSLPISERTLHRYIDDGKLRAYKLDGMLIFNVADIEAFLRRRSVGGGPVAPVLKEKPVPAPASAQSRVLSDDEAKSFFDNLPPILRSDWKPPKGLFEFNEPAWGKSVDPTERAKASAAALELIRKKSQK